MGWDRQPTPMTQWVRGIDTALGAAGGGALGLLSYFLFSAKKKPTDPLLHVLTGAAAGMGIANVAGTLGRRYMANSIMPYDYEGGKVLDALKPTSLGDAADRFYHQGILDEVRPEARGTPGDGHDFAEARRELVRRNMGIHNDNPQEDFFVKNTGDDSYRLNESLLARKLPEGDPRLRAQAAAIKAMKLELPVVTGDEGVSVGLTDTPAANDTSSMKAQHLSPFQGLLGGYEKTSPPAGQNPELRDTWTYELSPGQNQYLGGLAKSYLPGGQKPDLTELIKTDPDSAWYYGGNKEVGGTGALGDRLTPQDVNKSLGMRWAAHQLLDTNQTNIRIPLDPKLYPQASSVKGSL